MRLVFMGTPETAVPTLKRCVADGHEIVAVWTQPDRLAGRGNKLRVPPVKGFALERGLAVEQPEKIKVEPARELFESYRADIAVVVAYGRILPASFLQAPRCGCINVHFSLLPKYRGAAPVNWAIVRGEVETGVTTMLMDEGLDTGAILLQRAMRIGEAEIAPELLARLSGVGAELLSETLTQLDSIVPQPQRDADATQAPILKREDGLIDWSLRAEEIERRVRGLQPWPAAHTLFRGRRLVVWRAEIVEERARQGTSGDILAAQGEEISVACGGENALRLRELQVEGKRRMRARDFLNGMRVEVGEQLG